MLILIAVVSIVVLPLLYLLMSLKEFMYFKELVDDKVFLSTMTAVVRAGDLVRGRKLCNAAGSHILLIRYALQLLDGATPGTANLDGIVLEGTLAAEEQARVWKRFSLRRLLRDCICFGTPVVLLSIDGLKEGWVIGPSAVALIAVAVCGLVAAGTRQIVIQRLGQTEQTLRTLKETMVGYTASRSHA